MPRSSTASAISDLFQYGSALAAEFLLDPENYFLAAVFDRLSIEPERARSMIRQHMEQKRLARIDDIQRSDPGRGDGLR